MSRVVAFWSPSRSGATTLLVNTAVALAAGGTRVAVLDLNLTSPSVALHLDLIPAARPLDACLSRLLPALQAGRLTADDLERYLLSPPDLPSLRVVPGLLEPTLGSRLTEQGVLSLLEAASRRHPLIFCDLSAPVDSVGTLPLLEAASALFLICSPEYPARFHTRRYLVTLADLGLLDRVRLVLNRAGPAEAGRAGAELGLGPAAVVPHLPDLVSFAEEGRPAARRRGFSRPLRRFQEAVGRLARLSAGEPSGPAAGAPGREDEP
jgi:MinD-like ATPase involved in chromosome partitioning or flagellar assembly